MDKLTELMKEYSMALSMVHKMDQNLDKMMDLLLVQKMD